MPQFKENEEARQRKKNEELAPYIEAAMKRKEGMKPMREEEIPAFEAYGYSVAEVDVSKLPAGQARRFEQMRRMRNVVKRFEEKESAAATTAR